MIDISLQIYFDLCTLLGGLVSLIMKDLIDFMHLGKNWVIRVMILKNMQKRGKKNT